MKLNKRVRVLILPVLFVSFLIVATSLFFIERLSIYSLEHSAANLEVTELTGIFSKYDIIAKSFLASLIQSDAFSRFLNTEDERLKFMALSNGLDGLLGSLSSLSANSYTIAFIRGNGRIEYYYKNDLDPFSELEKAQVEWVQRLLQNKVRSDSHYFQGSASLAHCHIIDSLTLKAPINFNSSSTLAILILINPREFESRIQELTTQGQAVTFWSKDTTPPHIDTYEARKTLPGFGQIGIQISQERLNQRLKKLALRLVLGLIAITILTSRILQWLINHYVTKPIMRLEEQLVNIDLHSSQEIEIFDSNDEIGSLTRASSKLYCQLKARFEETKELAERDSLTTLYNRRIFALILDKMLGRAAKDNTQVALIYIDIDNFKYVNDNFGHTAGDALLRTFAFRLHEVTRAEDFIIQERLPTSTVARLAGDEFAVLINNYKDTNAPQKIASRILALCENGFAVKEMNYPISLSIGVATFPRHAVTPKDLILKADEAMYMAKNRGKNCISFSDSLPS